MNNNFLITIHDYEYNDTKNNWMDIEGFIENKSIEYIDEYYGIEKNFISTIKNFNDFFQKINISIL